jgi:hypothetical protein
MGIELKLRAEDLFDCLGNEEEKKMDRKVKVHNNPGLERIIQIYKEVASPSKLYDSLNRPHLFYSDCLNAISNLKNYNANTINLFSIIMPDLIRGRDFPDEIAIGYYLSSLINNCSEDRFSLDINDDLLINNIGYENNGKQININGSVCGCLGEEMNSGEILVNGNADYGIGGCMCGGKITINGNAGEELGGRASGGVIILNGNAGHGVGSNNEGGLIIINGNCAGLVGEEMTNGVIIINGNSAAGVGEYMTGGIIHLNEDYELSQNIQGGDIYHKGKLIVKDGRRV